TGRIEMISVYTADGPDLILTHYCVLGNQPRMKADPDSPPNQIVFRFAGGSNLEPAKDKHMCAVRSLGRVTRIFILQQSGMPTPIGRPDPFQESPKVTAPTLLPWHEQACPGPHVPGDEDHSSGVRATQPDPGDFATPGPAGQPGPPDSGIRGS